MEGSRFFELFKVFVESSQNSDFFPQKRPIVLYTCVACPELQSKISAMVTADPVFYFLDPKLDKTGSDSLEKPGLTFLLLTRIRYFRKHDPIFQESGSNLHLMLRGRLLLEPSPRWFLAWQISYSSLRIFGLGKILSERQFLNSMSPAPPPHPHLSNRPFL